MNEIFNQIVQEKTEDAKPLGFIGNGSYGLVKNIKIKDKIYAGKLI